MCFRSIKVVFISLSLMMSGLANAGVITTTFASNNGQSGNMFNVDILADDLWFTGFDLNLDDNADIKIYSRLGGYEAGLTSSAGWDLIFDQQVTSAGVDLPSFVDIVDTLFQRNSTYGFYITAVDTVMNYTNGSVLDAVYAEDSALKIREGVGKGSNFGQTFSPRVWNGSIYYTAANVPEPSTLAIFALALIGFTLRKPRSLK